MGTRSSTLLETFLISCFRAAKNLVDMYFLAHDIDTGLSSPLATYLLPECLATMAFARHLVWSTSASSSGSERFN